MVRQGDIVMADFSPNAGHEQGGRRPALVVSNDVFNEVMSITYVCPITSTDKGLPFQVRLDSRTKTTGVVMCEQAKSVDLKARRYQVIERAPQDLLEHCLKIVISMIEPAL